MGYTSPYAKQLKTVTNGLLNRDKFAYDMNADAMYNTYKDQYMKYGNMAMRDTMGDTAGLTGGMLSSAAINAGNSAYQSQMDALNDKVTDLYGQALSKYNTETNDLYSRFNLLYQLDQQKYQQFRDNVGDDFNEKKLAWEMSRI